MVVGAMIFRNWTVELFNGHSFTFFVIHFRDNCSLLSETVISELIIEFIRGSSWWNSSVKLIGWKTTNDHKNEEITRIAFNPPHILILLSKTDDSSQLGLFMNSNESTSFFFFWMCPIWILEVIHSFRNNSELYINVTLYENEMKH